MLNVDLPRLNVPDDFITQDKTFSSLHRNMTESSEKQIISPDFSKLMYNMPDDIEKRNTKTENFDLLGNFWGAINLSRGNNRFTSSSPALDFAHLVSTNYFSSIQIQAIM